MRLLIQNGKIITADNVYTADILCENEIITQIAPNIKPEPDTQIISAKDKLVFPGFIDPHTHIYLPAMGTYAADTYESGTISALCGGTTTIFDFPTPSRNEEPQKAIDTWLSKAQNQACCDYAFHLCVTRFDPQIASQLKEIIASGITSFKVFLAYKDVLALEDRELYQVLKFAKDMGVLVLAHCENADIVKELQKDLAESGKIGPEYHYDSRPPLIEADGTRHFCAIAETLKVPIYIVHVSCQEALQYALESKLRGHQVFVETVISYLLLDKTYAEQPNFEGAKYIMSPPLRDKKNQAILWNGLQTGLVSTIGTDHAPFTTTQKAMGKQDFRQIPNGLSGIEERVRLLYTYGVCSGKLDIHRFVDVASTQVAKIFGLFPGKGTIQIGSDADLVVYDPNYQDIISAKTHHSKNDYSPFEGFKVQGRCSAVIVRGHLQVQDGQFIGQKGTGKFLTRQPRKN